MTQIHTNIEKHFPDLNTFNGQQLHAVMDILFVNLMNTKQIHLKNSTDIRTDALTEIRNAAPGIGEIATAIYRKWPGSGKEQPFTETDAKALSNAKKTIVNYCNSDGEGQAFALALREAIISVATSKHHRNNLGQNLATLTPLQAQEILQKFNSKCADALITVPDEPSYGTLGAFPDLKTVVATIGIRAKGEAEPSDMHERLVIARGVVHHYSSYKGEKPLKLQLKDAAELLNEAIAEAMKPARNLSRTGMARTKTESNAG